MAKCISLINLKSGHFVPCGKCVPCIKNRASAWSFRLMQEYLRSTTAYFITFTYDTDKVPITNKGYMSLDKKDFQLFMKRLRKKSKAPLKYYCAGEYGSKKSRPHYHAIIFNVDLTILIGSSFHNQIKNKVIPLDGKTQFPCPIWGNGTITIGQVNEASVGYCLKYITKPSTIGKHQNDDRQREFAIMSKKLGDNYINRTTKKFHKADLTNRFYVPLKDGITAPMPRYYKEKIYTKHEREHIANTMINREIQKLEKMTSKQVQKTEHDETLRKTKYAIDLRHLKRNTSL